MRAGLADVGRMRACLAEVQSTKAGVADGASVQLG
jgi:hypothetical protein